MALTEKDRAKGREISRQVRQERIVERAQRREVIDTLTDWSDREQLPKAALQTVLALMASIADDLEHLEPATTALDLQRKAEAAKTVHSLFRLEMGESTANTVSVQVSKDELEARLAKLREQDH